MFHAEILASELIFLHGLEKQGWVFIFDRAKKRFGMCNYTTKTISLSKYLTAINSEEKVINTILHEIAHALAGYNAGHGKKWKETMINLGQIPSRCYGNEVITPQLQYTGKCKNYKICKTEIQRKTLPKNTFFKQKKLPANTVANNLIIINFQKNILLNLLKISYFTPKHFFLPLSPLALEEFEVTNLFVINTVQ
ncbi:TPA: SprT-like domain-containing protein [Candidatus Gracilibacteria bacterium]|nr:SprT-like domain-containing protein [Candidatus Gracilibacteria bacterium]